MTDRVDSSPNRLRAIQFTAGALELPATVDGKHTKDHSSIVPETMIPAP